MAQSQSTPESRRQARLAFERMRSESLHDSHTTNQGGNPTGTPSAQTPSKVDNRSWYQKVIDALAGKPNG